MKHRFFSTAVFLCCFFSMACAQPDPTKEVSPDAAKVSSKINESGIIPTKRNVSTPVKDQAKTNTCWSFSTTSLVESQVLKDKLGAYDLSEMHTVRYIYVEKAKNYLLRQGHAHFSEGGLGHDVIRAISLYGAMPEPAYSGLKDGEKRHDHGKLFKELKRYLDSTLKIKSYPIAAGWLEGYHQILDQYLGVVPKQFRFNNKSYTAESFAKDALHFSANDYVNVTSFTHQPYYEPYVIPVPDNFSNGAYYNLPLNDMMAMVKEALNNGYSVMWDTDISNNGFRHKQGLALLVPETENIAEADFNTAIKEARWDEKIRQERFEGLVTQDDHLMHIVGMGQSKEGKPFFMVKNSLGSAGPANGYVYVSEAYFAINTISLVLPKAAISKALLSKCRIQ